jgi:hypothetical protein
MLFGKAPIVDEMLIYASLENGRTIKFTRPGNFEGLVKNVAALSRVPQNCIEISHNDCSIFDEFGYREIT